MRLHHEDMRLHLEDMRLHLEDMRASREDMRVHHEDMRLHLENARFLVRPVPARMGARGTPVTKPARSCDCRRGVLAERRAPPFRRRRFAP
jgi:hypothetical protein